MKVIDILSDKMKIVRGDILLSECEAIVNPVNCKGVMGAGLAKAIKDKYPLVYEQYRCYSELEKVEIGKVLVTLTFNPPWEYPKFVFNLPTKDDWKDNSSIAHVRSGLEDLVTKIKDYQISSIAIPALGCGCGKLSWNLVKPAIIENLEVLENVEVLIYEPK